MAASDEKVPSGGDKGETLADSSPPKETKPADVSSSLLGPSSLLLSEGNGGLMMPLDSGVEFLPSAPAGGTATSDKPPQPAPPSREQLGAIRLDDLSEAPPLDESTLALAAERDREPLPVSEESSVPLSRPTASASKKEDEELGVILWDEDEMPGRPSLKTEPMTAAVTSPTSQPADSVPLPVAGETEAAGQEMPLDNLLAADESEAAAKVPLEPAKLEPQPKEETPSSVDDQSQTSSLLLESGSEIVSPHPPMRSEEPVPLPLDAQETFDDSWLQGRSSLLLGTEPVVQPTAREESRGEPKRGKRRRQERVRTVPPATDAPVQWYANAEACAVYCRKHSRPLLLYFTTGDLDQCRAYEEAIRTEEMRPFLCSYVCCMVNMAQPEGRAVAMRLGVPTDSPSMVLLSPSGREYARVLKAEVDWHFLATMLFWALR